MPVSKKPRRKQRRKDPENSFRSPPLLRYSSAQEHYLKMAPRQDLDSLRNGRGQVAEVVDLRRRLRMGRRLANTLFEDPVANRLLDLGLEALKACEARAHVGQALLTTPAETLAISDALTVVDELQGRTTRLEQGHALQWVERNPAL